MKEVSIRPKNNYLHTATWEELFSLTEHWKNDLNFYQDEIKFLNQLLGKYFIWMTKEAGISKIQGILDQLDQLSLRQTNLSLKIDKHLSHLSLLMEKAFNDNEAWFREEHIKVEEDIFKFIRDLRILKKEIFGFTEHILESEKLKHLLNP